MNYQTGQMVHGFRVCWVKESHDPEGTAFLMEHERTGAPLFWLDNGAENMVFSISFRTLPEDSTGVFHILEHSVLCGSEKYPMKEPFVELMKSSMNTFLNAMTFPDMTMFPVSSRNPRDLMNLTDVYLDAVLSPISIKDRKRFCQEGWHIDLDENGNPEYRGVVYNEMKGAMSDTDTLIDHELDAMLFPDTYYGFNSGGDPEKITDLTWDEYRKQYERCYHPSNAYIYLDGSVPADEILEMLDARFSAYEKRKNNPEFTYQKPRGSERTIRYELGKEEDPANKGYLTTARITGSWKDRTENMARGIICDVLTGSNESVLKRNVLEKELAEDFSLTIDDTGLQSWICMHAEHITDGKEQEILDLLKKTGEEIAQNGLERQAVEASINRAAFHLREEEEPQGIGRCIRCMGTWLYGGDPLEALENEILIRTMKAWLEDGTFDRLAADMLLNRENIVTLHTLPSHTIGEEKRAREAAKLQDTLCRMTGTERTETDRIREEIAVWQRTPDREKDLSTLPVLKLGDADIEPEWISTENETIHGIRVLIHRIPCNGIAYLRVYFSLTDLTLEELTRASLFAGMLGKLPTRKYDALHLQQEIKRLTGSFGFSVVSMTQTGDEEHSMPCLVAFASTLEENIIRTQELLAEVMLNTVTEGQENRIRDMMMQNEMGARQRIVSAGHLVAVKKCLSRYSSDGAVKNALDGDRAIQYIHSFAVRPEQQTEGFLQTARKILSDSFCRKRMILSITSGNETVPEVLADAFPEGTPVPPKTHYHEEGADKTGFRIPAQTGFAVRGYRLSKCGKVFTGSMWLAASILTLSYYWNKIRVQGGAYGAGLQIDRGGNLFSYSFRDPTPARTLSADAGAGAFLCEFARKGEKLDRYIISALNELNPLLSPREKGVLGDTRTLTGYTREERERIRKEVLKTTPDQLADCGEWLDCFASDGSICVVAHEEALRQCGGIQIRDL